MRAVGRRLELLVRQLAEPIPFARRDRLASSEISELPPARSSAEPISQRPMFGARRFQRSKYRSTDCLLLAAQMILKKLVSGNVAGIHARDCVVHQELGIEL